MRPELLEALKEVRARIHRADRDYHGRPRAIMDGNHRLRDCGGTTCESIDCDRRERPHRVILFQETLPEIERGWRMIGCLASPSKLLRGIRTGSASAHSLCEECPPSVREPSPKRAKTGRKPHCFRVGLIGVYWLELF
jgi:hypothetical protein